MGCFRCAKIQTDPIKGSSPWARLVVGGQQVLLCPDCQKADPNWTVAGDQCPNCRSTRIALVMNSIVCRACGKDTPRGQ